MQRSSFVPVIVALCAGVALAMVFAQTRPQAAQAQTSFSRSDLDEVVIGHPDGTLVRVAGKGDITVVPSIAVVDAGVVFEGIRAEDATREVNDRVGRIIQAVKRVGVPEERIQTVSYAVRPQFDFSNNGAQEPRIVSYIAQSVVRIRAEVDQLDEVLDAARRQDANQIDNIVFEVENEEGAFLEALALATERARGRADRIARALGGRVIEIVEVRESNLSQTPRPVPFARTGVSTGLAVEGGVSPIAPGEQEIVAEVELGAVIVVE